MYTFVCEKCGKTVQCKSDPSTWKQRICLDCRGTTGKTTTTKTSYAKFSPNPAKYEPKKTFDLMTYISEMVVVYKALKEVCKEEGIEIPEANLAQWTTSVMIQKDRG